LLLKLARTGAEATLKELRAEVLAIERAFPDLATGRQRKLVEQALKPVRKRRRHMSAAARSAVSKRMKKYWADRRKATSKSK
jgi:hypothetical protein